MLGSGGFGAVYLANDALLKGQLACKIVNYDDILRTVREKEEDMYHSSRDACQYMNQTEMSERWSKRMEQRRKSIIVEKNKIMREVEILSKLSHVCCPEYNAT